MSVPLLSSRGPLDRRHLLFRRMPRFQGLGGVVLRRLVTLVPMLLIISIAAFSLALLLPGDPATAALGPNPTAEQIAAARKALDLDKPAPVRYVSWLGKAVTGDFGVSVTTGQPVREELGRRFGVTASIAGFTLLLAAVLGTLIGVVQAVFANRLPDRVLLGAVSLGLSIPNFWLATLLVAFFAVRLGWLPAIGYVSPSESVIEWAKHLVLPVATLAVFPAAELARQIRTGLVHVLGLEYIRAARARGFGPLRVIGKHALKNAAAPALTIFGLRVGYLLAGSIIVEQIFVMPGLGAYTLAAITNRDATVIQAMVLITAVIVVLVNLLVDVAYMALNPRVRVTS
ncbi:MAG TPA: ABC transporter permease [Candidatus Dormibacteraeota bacterium]|nr:ABC transporter permease [Candidatus Dormibacteraeota bacterium]